MAFFYNFLGTLGVICCLLAFLYLQIGKLSAHGFTYSFLNFLGGGLILISLMFEWNLPAALMEGSWVLISLYGLFRYFTRTSHGR